VAIAVNALTITHQPVMTRDTLLATKWRLAGAMFSMMPADGFPITFHPDGSVETKNLGGITRWSLEGDELVLSGGEHDTQNGAKPIRMTWLPDRRMFRECHLPSRIGLFVFPESTRAPSLGCDDVPTAVLKLHVSLDRTVYRQGDRIVATATLTNVGNAPTTIRHSTDETGRSDGFRVELTNDKDLSNALRGGEPRPSAAGIGESLAPGGTTTRQLVLNRPLGPLEPGKYRLKITYEAAYPDGQIDIDSEPVTLEIRAPAAARRHQDTVTVTVFVELFPALSVQRTVTV
jgi:hypothetical protein